MTACSLLSPRLATAAVVAGLAFALSEPLSAAEPTPIATVPCTGLPSNGATIPGLKLFARPIDDPRVLLLVQRLAHLDSGARQALLKAGAGSRDPNVRAQVDAAVRGQCLGETVEYAILRAAVELGFAWDNADDARLEGFINGPLAVAIGAVAARGGLPVDVVAAAMRDLPSTDPDQAPSAPATSCADARWEIRDQKDPLYPHAALQAGEIGTITITVALDPLGLVRYAKVKQWDVDLDPAKGGGAMIYGALISAAEARYKTNKAGCSPSADTFLYKVTYSRDGVAVDEGR